MKVDQSISLAGAAAADADNASAKFDPSDLSEQASSEVQQDGVRQAEAITQSWTKGSLRTMFAL
jgi:hypothetical protein